MSKLPNCKNAEVQDDKILKYLLNLNHPEGKPKAIFFGKFGFNIDNYFDFKKALLILACEGEAENFVDKPPFGIRVTVIGKLFTPDNRNPIIKTGWFINTNENIPRLITALPLN